MDSACKKAAHGEWRQTAWLGWLVVCMLWLLTWNVLGHPVASESQEPLQRLAFGSCSDQTQPQPVWRSITAIQPDLFLFLGDNVYADTEDMQEMWAIYEKFAAVPEFAEFRRQVPIMATWDDHDYGANDAGAEYKKKEESKELLLKFFSVPADAEVRQRPGIYQAKTFGPEGQRVQVILLDARTFRSDLVLDPSPYRRYRPNLDPESTILGEAQWEWLRERLMQPAEFRLIVSGVQVLGYAAGFESWKNFPHEQERLFATIHETRAGGVIFLSGDAHFTQIKRGDGGVSYPLYDFTSSGLTHGNANGAARPAPLALYRPYGGINFGTIEFDWQADPALTMRAHDQAGNVVFEHTVHGSTLQPSTEIIE